jgi:hypothetical protein
MVALATPVPAVRATVVPARLLLVPMVRSPAEDSVMPSPARLAFAPVRDSVAVPVVAMLTVLAPAAVVSASTVRLLADCRNTLLVLTRTAPPPVTATPSRLDASTPRLPPVACRIRLPALVLVSTAPAVSVMLCPAPVALTVWSPAPSKVPVLAPWKVMLPAASRLFCAVKPPSSIRSPPCTLSVPLMSMPVAAPRVRLPVFDLVSASSVSEPAVERISVSALAPDITMFMPVRLMLPLAVRLPRPRSSVAPPAPESAATVSSLSLKSSVPAAPTLTALLLLSTLSAPSSSVPPEMVVVPL